MSPHLYSFNSKLTNPLSRSIPKLFSDSELQISAKAIQELFTSLKISPGFWSVVKRFGVKDQEEKCVHESSGGFNEESWEPFSKSYGFSYNVKYVEHHGRETYDPWSMRQIGLHHEYDHETQNNTFIILNPSKALTSRLNNVTAPIEPVAIHRMVLASVTERWNDYLAYLEYCFGDISKKGLLANPTRNTSAVEVRFSDSQRIQKLQDTMLRVSQMLSMNMSVFDHLLSSPDLSSSMSRAVDGLENLSHSRSLASLRTQTKLRLQRSDNLLRRLDGSSALVRSILDAQSLSTLQDSSQTTAELAALAREDSRKATKDARTLSTITILGFVYLPASFVATLLGTQYIHVDGARSGIWMNSEMWIFLVLTAILLLVTVGGWAVWERQNSLADRKQAEVEDQREKSV